MADHHGSYKSRQNVSRHTMVMHKAKEDDARRVEERDAADPSGDSARISDRLMARGAGTRVLERETRDGRTASGRQVVVRHDGSGRYSTRLAGRQAESIRVAGGDTIIRYKSGDMVIRRGARRAQLRKQMLVAYAVGYFVLFGCYVYFLFAGTATITPDDFITKAFALRHSSDVIDLERASMEAMRGNRTPAEIRMAETLSFYDENKDTIHVASGDRLTLLTAAKLGHAILEDQKLDAAKRNFNKPFRIYKESYLTNVNWPYWLTVYNSLGFFLLLALFLWRPLMHWLGTQGKKTAVALQNAHDAQETAAGYRDKYRALAGEVDELSEKRRADTAARAVAERENALDAARKQAHAIAGGVEGTLQGEAMELAGRIGAKAAIAACEQARTILEGRLGQKEHDAAVDDLIADIATMDFSGRTA